MDARLYLVEPIFRVIKFRDGTQAEYDTLIQPCRLTFLSRP
jgi:hypothetical protein